MTDPPKPKMSKQMAKRLFNAHVSSIGQMDSRRQRLEVEHAELSHKYANALALLEAMVRRHGTQVFDRAMVQSVCAHGRVRYEQTPDRITVMLNPRPELIEQPESPLPSPNKSA